MKPKLNLPKTNSNSEKVEYDCPDNCVLIGANGSGKSKLGAWIETHTPEATVVHRISAQRALSIPDFAPSKNEEEATNELHWGHPDKQYAKNQFKTNHRWQGKLTTFLQNDFDKLLSALFAKQSRRNRDYAVDGRRRAEGKLEAISPIDSEIDKLHALWEEIMPQRKLVLDDGKVNAITAEGLEYNGKEMSDGERVVIYLIGQALCAPDNSIIVIDEPEIHLHKTLMNRLWTLVEAYREDCLFVYITHDLEFASSRTTAMKIWIKKYQDKDMWDWDVLPVVEDLPEALIIEISGNRRPVIFVEGEYGSLDYTILQAAYSDFFIYPRGSCTKVIEATKAFRSNPSFHKFNAQGIVDRDFRSNEEISSLKECGIHALRVAEIENLLCVPEVIKIVASHLGLPPKEILDAVQKFILSNLNSELENQISLHATLGLKYRLSLFEKKGTGKDALKQALSNLVGEINVDDVYDISSNLFNNILAEADYEKALMFYNRKSLASRISKLFGLREGQYGELILRLIKTEMKTEIVDALSLYLPKVN